MQILILTPQLPHPPHQGTTIRNYNLIRELAQRHTIDLFSFLAPGEVLTAENPLNTLCRRVGVVPQPLRSLRKRGVDTLTSRWPDMALRLESAAMHEQLAHWLAATNYDLVQVEGIELAQYGGQGAGGRGQEAGFDVSSTERGKGQEARGKGQGAGDKRQGARRLSIFAIV